ncbi:MAG: hydrogenase accessory protein HypB [Deltaproteobacteria bacterium]|nr:MAG: hydrogenase accessory protein HypB [Deltaproteobacteria bacterium]
MTDEVRLIEVRQDIHADNDRAAGELRRRLAEHGTFLLNLMSSPGAGKTTTILATCERLATRFRVAVLEADIDSKVDAEKVSAAGIPAVQLRTGGFCHLDAAMVAKGLDALDLGALDLVIIENVGNLVCPAEFDTGAIKNAMILSVPEGDDKPLKYPLMFSVCDVLLVGKIDYLGLSDFDVERLRGHVRRLNPEIEVFEVSAKTGAGMDAWAEWLAFQVEAYRESSGA